MIVHVWSSLQGNSVIIKANEITFDIMSREMVSVSYNCVTQMKVFWYNQETRFAEHEDWYFIES